MPDNAGLRSTKVRIEQSTAVRDPESNEEVLTWALFCEAWVSIDPRTGGEYFEGGSRYSQAVVNMTGDWMELRRVTPGMRLVMGIPDQVYDIKTVLPDNDRRGRVKLQCVGGEGAR
jgi:head-tail adaptor